MFDKIQHPVVIKILSKHGLEGNFLNLVKIIYENAIANIIPKWETWSFHIKI